MKMPAGNFDSDTTEQVQAIPMELGPEILTHRSNYHKVVLVFGLICYAVIINNQNYQQNVYISGIGTTYFENSSEI